MTQIRLPAVAGTFYPADPRQLRAAVQKYLGAVEPLDSPVPKALIVPHAGYIFSGQIAANGFALLAPARAIIRRVVLLGTAHRAAVEGLAASGADAFATPLGNVAIGKEALAQVLARPQVYVDEVAHQQDHSLEVQLPFLQEVLERFTIVPFLVGRAGVDQVADVLEALWGGPETLILVSSDLSHYHSYETATQIDRATAQAIEQLKPERIGHDKACGYHAIGGLLTVAQRRGLLVKTVDLRNSADTSGPRDNVVGYGTFAFEETNAG